MRNVHIVAGLDEWNGMANTAREFRDEEISAGDDAIVTNCLSAIVPGVDVVYIHGAWLPVLWKAAKMAKQIGANLFIRPAGSYDPVRLRYHGWKKRLVAPFEHAMLNRADVVLATCSAEAEWIRAYHPRATVEITDLKRFFNLGMSACSARPGGNTGQSDNDSNSKLKTLNSKLNLLYLGRRHPLKGVEYLEGAVKGIDGIKLRLVSNAFGDEKEKVWDWCDVLVLPTLSENFGRVVAEAIERGKRVITTDGAPAWGDSLEFRVLSLESKESPDSGDKSSGAGEIWSGYGGRLLYLKGYRDGTPEQRVRLLKEAIGGLY